MTQLSADPESATPAQAGRAAILLAAGSSTRMGTPKALLPWEGTTLLGYAVRQLRAAGAARVVVVLGANAEQVRAALPHGDAVLAVVNPDYMSGRGSSIRVGASAVPAGTTAIVLQSVDQPCPAAILRRLYELVETEGADVALPLFDERPGHPVCLSARLLPELTSAREEDQGLRAVVRRHRDTTRVVRVDDPIVHLNLNDQAAYDAAIRTSQPPGASPR